MSVSTSSPAFLLPWPRPSSSAHPHASSLLLCCCRENVIDVRCYLFRFGLLSLSTQLRFFLLLAVSLFELSTIFSILNSITINTCLPSSSVHFPFLLHCCYRVVAINSARQPADAAFIFCSAHHRPRSSSSSVSVASGCCFFFSRLPVLSLLLSR